MAWYKKYLRVYEKPFGEAPSEIIEEVKENLKRIQSTQPLVSVIIIAYNEEKRLLANLWSLSNNKCKYPLEIIGIDNHSSDRTGEIYKALGVPYYTELRQGPGYARNCGLKHAKGKYTICIDSDTLYPPLYIETMINYLSKKDIVAVYSLWSYMPDHQHSRSGIKIYEFLRDTYLLLQSVRRPELCVRGMVFAHDTELGRREGYRVDIKRGEDGSLALCLKKYGKLYFVHSRKARAVTGYGTIGSEGSFFNSFKLRAIKALKGLKNLFTKKEEYQDDESNLINNPDKKDTLSQV